MLARPIDAIVFGSYARGDFGEWSDIDLLVLAKGLPKNPLERLQLVEKCLEKAPDIEPLILEPHEASSRLSVGDPAVKEAVEKGIVVYESAGFYKGLKRGIDRR